MWNAKFVLKLLPETPIAAEHSADIRGSPPRESASHEMSSQRRGVLSVVERGWRGARGCSLELAAQGIPVRHAIKGTLSREILAMIAPREGIRVTAAPRWRFRLQVWSILIGETLTRRLRWVMIDHERTWRELAWWCRLWGLTPVWIAEVAEAYELRVAGAPRTLAELFLDETR